ncbi:glutathione synthetase, chloroplastic [Iris pallida]|uniref:Glutathione synthetase n=1 Tax=Iris pallida TaxID=29817 RepID=A0AAX6HTR0_IRIPA|nr:glutathione synthetase, chloroplastic [Iris pallida]
MGSGCSSLSFPHPFPPQILTTTTTNTTKTLNFTPPFSLPSNRREPVMTMSHSSSLANGAVGSDGPKEDQKRTVTEELLGKMTADALVWSALHGLVVGDRRVPRSGTVPGVGLVHAPFALLPMTFPRSHWSQARELAPIFNELVDRVSLDGKFLQDSLSRTKKVDAFTGRLLDIHSKMLEIKKTEDIRLGLFRSDYMLDNETNLLFQIELNTIASSFPGLSCLVSELHRNLLDHYGKDLGLDSREVPGNTAVSQFAEALAKAWGEYGNSSAVVLVVVQPEERNMYDQYSLSTIFPVQYFSTNIRRTLAEVDAEGQMLSNGTLLVGDQAVAVIYFRAGYTPNDYPSESEWAARFMIEKSSAIKCPSISYHLAGTKKIQQELAKPDILERFLDSEEDVAKVRKCFAGLWSLDNYEGVKAAMEKPELFVLKPQREGGGNNIYGDDVRETLARLQEKGSEELAAYILMQRIFPTASRSYLMREGICHQENAISELGVYGAYLRNRDKVIMNQECGYLMRTKVSSSDEGGVAAGFAVLDSIYLT